MEPRLLCSLHQALQRCHNGQQHCSWCSKAALKVVILRAGAGRVGDRAAGGHLSGDVGPAVRRSRGGGKGRQQERCCSREGFVSASKSFLLSRAAGICSGLLPDKLTQFNTCSFTMVRLTPLQPWAFLLSLSLSLFNDMDAGCELPSLVFMLPNPPFPMEGEIRSLRNITGKKKKKKVQLNS